MQTGILDRPRQHRFKAYTNYEKYVSVWQSFSPAEIACRCTGKLLIHEPALGKLQALRDRLGKPLIVLSAYRSPEHNRAVGGAIRLKHLDGAAFDIAIANHDPVVFEAAAREVGFLGFGFYPGSGFMIPIWGRHASGASVSRSRRSTSRRDCREASAGRRVGVARLFGGDGSGPCSGSGGCKVCRSSHPSTPLSATISTDRSLSSRPLFKQNRAAALAEWRGLCVG